MSTINEMSVVLLVFLCVASPFTELGAITQVGRAPDDRGIYSKTTLVMDDLMMCLTNGASIALMNGHMTDDPDQEWKLRSSRVMQDRNTGHGVLSLIWDRHNQVRKVDYDLQTEEIIRYLDTSRKGSEGIRSLHCLTETDAAVTACEYLTAISGSSADLKLAYVLARDGGWSVGFQRFVSGYRVMQDFVRMTVNLYTGDVYSFVKRWTPEFCAPSAVLSRQYTIARMAELGLDVSCGPNAADPIWVASETTPGIAVLAWVIESRNTESWISCEDGSLVGRAVNLVQYEGQSVNTDVVNDEPGDEFYDIMDYVYDIMHDELPSANYINLPTESQWIAASSSYVFFSVGHGVKEGTKNKLEISRPNNYLEYVYGDEITNAPLRYLVYLLHCHSAWSSPGYEEDSVAYQFLYNSKHTELEGRVVYQCAIVGFDDTFDTVNGTDFTEVFWDALADGDTVLQAFNDADSQYPEVGDICIILGNSGIKLDG